MLREKSKGTILSITLGLLMAAAAVHAEQDAAPQTTNGKSDQDSTQPIGAQGGYRAFVDPATGRLVSPTPEQARQPLPLSAEEENAFSTSDQGLYQEQLPGGGYKANLQGRFRSSVFATVDPAGGVTINHVKPGTSASQVHGQGGE